MMDFGVDESLLGRTKSWSGSGQLKRTEFSLPQVSGMTNVQTASPSCRATILVDTHDSREVQEAELWLKAVRDRLTYISDQQGCGCCVLSWDVEGPAELIATVPEHLGCSSEWTRPEDISVAPSPAHLLRQLSQWRGK